MITKYSLIVLMLIGFTEAYACTCNDPYNFIFCESASPHAHVVLGVVGEYNSNAARDVEVLDNMHGDVTDKVISVYGQDGLNCNEELGVFSVGDTIIFALHYGEDNGVKYWDLYGCNRHFLEYENGVVKGQIAPGVNEMEYAEFKEKLLPCLDTGVSNEEVETHKESLMIFPNPAQNLLNIEMYSGEIIDRVVVLDINGKVVYIEKYGINKMDVSILTPGAYFVQVTTSQGERLGKFLRL